MVIKRLQLIFYKFALTTILQDKPCLLYIKYQILVALATTHHQYKHKQVNQQCTFYVKLQIAPNHD